MKKAVQGSKTNIPRGMATHLPEGASLRRHAQEAFLTTFFRWGYKEVVTPVFEYLDILSAGLSNRLLEKSYKFTDRESGKLMLLRPDITPQVARMAAGILSDEPNPLRLCKISSSSIGLLLQVYWSLKKFWKVTRVCISPISALV